MFYSFSADSVQFGWRDPATASRQSYYDPMGVTHFADGLRADQSE